MFFLSVASVSFAQMQICECYALLNDNHEQIETIKFFFHEIWWVEIEWKTTTGLGLIFSDIMESNAKYINEIRVVTRDIA